jgi:hypothetical protein
MKTKEESGSNELNDHVIRIDDDMIIDDDVVKHKITSIEDDVITNGMDDNDKMTSEEWKEVLSKVKTVRIWHDDMWDIPNDLNVLDVHRINPVTSDEEILEATLLSIRAAAKCNSEAVVRHKKYLSESVIEQLRMRGFDVRFYSNWIAIVW